MSPTSNRTAGSGPCVLRLILSETLFITSYRAFIWHLIGDQDSFHMHIYILKHFDELQIMADEHKPHIICLNETMYISEAEIAEENHGTTSFGEKGLFICRHIYLGTKLLLQINSCCQEVMQNNEMTFPWFIHCWMLEKKDHQVAVLALDSKS